MWRLWITRHSCPCKGLSFKFLTMSKMDFRLSDCILSFYYYIYLLLYPSRLNSGYDMFEPDLNSNFSVGAERELTCCLFRQLTLQNFLNSHPTWSCVALSDVTISSNLFLFKVKPTCRSLPLTHITSAHLDHACTKKLKLHIRVKNFDLEHRVIYLVIH